MNIKYLSLNYLFIIIENKIPHSISFCTLSKHVQLGGLTSDKKINTALLILQCFVYMSKYLYLLYSSSFTLFSMETPTDPKSVRLSIFSPKN